MQTLEIRKIAAEVVQEALKARENQCKLHSERLDKFEGSLEAVKTTATNIDKNVAILIDNMKDSKKHSDELFEKANANKIAITENKTNQEALEKRVKAVEDEKATNKTIVWTAVITVAVALYETVFKKGG